MPKKLSGWTKIFVENAETKAVFLHSVKEKAETIAEPVQEYGQDYHQGKFLKWRIRMRKVEQKEAQEGKNPNKQNQNQKKPKVSIVFCDA